MNNTSEHKTVRIGKLLSKLSGQDRLIHVFDYKPQKSTHKNHGNLYFVIDINHPNKDSQKVVDSIIETTVKYFYKNLDDTLGSFEIALRHVNEKMAELAEQGNTSWIDNINSLIAVINDHDIHITQIGTAEAFLIRNKIISHISEGLSEKNDTKHPLNTFANISSGQMIIGDRVVMSTEHLFNNISLDRIRRLSVQHSPTTCAAELARILAQENIRSIGAIIFEATTEERLAKEVIRPQPEEIILQDRKFEGTKFSVMVKQSEKYFSGISSFFQNIKSLIPKKKISKPENDKNIRKAKPIPKKINNVSKPNSRLENKKSTNNILEKINNKSPYKAYIFFGAIIFLIIIFVVSITYIRGNQNLKNKQLAVQKTLDEANSFYGQAENSLIIGDKGKAKELLSQSQTSLTQIKTSPYFSEEIKNLDSKIYSKIDEVDNIIRIDVSKPLADLSTVGTNKYSQLQKIGDNLFSFSNNLASISLKTGKITNITGFDIKNLVASSTINEANNLIFYQNDLIQKFDPSGNTVQDLSTLDSNWKPAIDLQTYYNNLYLLSPKENQIFKYSTLGGTDYSSAAGYLNNPNDIDLSNAISFTIDGSIYLLKKDGSVTLFNKGDKVDYQLKNIPEPYSRLANPSQIYTEEELDYLYIADSDNKRILEFNKETGEYSKQFVGEDLGSIDNFTVNAKIKTIYILSDNKIYTVNT